MPHLIAELLNSPGTNTIVTLVLILWLHRDMNDRFSGLSERLARVEGILEILRPRAPSDTD